MLGAAEDSKANMDIAGSLRIVHAHMLYGPATAYAYGLAVHTP